MDAVKLVKLFFGVIGGGILLGGILGAMLGFLSPELIELFMRRGGSGDPVRTGTALGLLNGGIYGFFGAIVVVILAVVISNRRADTQS